MESGRPYQVRNLVLVVLLALGVRALTLRFFPIDWNWDSYHHWQISWLSLNIGFPLGRLWDLNGCEYYWAILPHLVEAWILGLANTASIQPFRLLNSGLGALNAGLVLLIGSKHFGARVGSWSGALFAVFPVAAVFDVLGLQDTIALTLILASLFMSNTRPFWSGILLALAGQSRNEFLLASAVLVFWICASERFETRRQPMLIGWVAVTGIAAWFTYGQTGNPFYGLYWNLVNVFTAGRPTTETAFLPQMLSWVGWKLEAWAAKPTGLVILLVTSVCIAYFALTLLKKPSNYHTAYFLASSTLTLPIFLPYVGSDMRSLLIMLRSAIPIAALGIPLLVAVVLRAASGNAGRKVMFIILILFSLGLPLAYLAYQPFEAEAASTFAISDKTAKLYIGGTVVCDYPMMNYRLVDRWSLGSRSIIGNHYAPQYLGVSEPWEYVKWLAVNRVTVWVRYGVDSEIVYDALTKASPVLLREAFEDSDIEVYVVDPGEMDRLLFMGR